MEIDFRNPAAYYFQFVAVYILVWLANAVSANYKRLKANKSFFLEHKLKHIISVLTPKTKALALKAVLKAKHSAKFINLVLFPTLDLIISVIKSMLLQILQISKRKVFVNVG